MSEIEFSNLSILSKTTIVGLISSIISSTCFLIIFLWVLSKINSENGLYSFLAILYDLDKKFLVFWIKLDLDKQYSNNLETLFLISSSSNLSLGKKHNRIS